MNEHDDGSAVASDALAEAEESAPQDDIEILFDAAMEELADADLSETDLPDTDLPDIDLAETGQAEAESAHIVESDEVESDEVESDEVEPEVEREPPSQENLDAAARAIEGIAMVATDPVEDQVLAQLLELPVATIRQLCADLAASYEQEHRGFQLVEVAGGWRFQTHPDTHPYIERFVLEGQTARLSSAALETLAIVAYKQPISRGQVSAIRGVNVDGVLRTLVQRGYVDEVGRDLGPGLATLFGTTQDFLEKLGLASLDDLPSLGDFVPAAEVVEALEQTLRADPIDDLATVADLGEQTDDDQLTDEQLSNEQLVDEHVSDEPDQLPENQLPENQLPENES